jgi:serine/threonine protein phosphatase 1
MRTLVIGDIHGGLKALIQLLEVAKVTVNDTLIFLGDYVDGWSESAQLMDYLIELDKTHHCVFIKGNHDVWCEDWLKTGNANETWLFHGGQLTVDSYTNYDTMVKLKHLNFFECMPFYVESEDNLYIHAGFTSMYGPKKEFHTSNYNWDRTLWEMAMVMDTRIKKGSLSYPKRLTLYKEIYIGHTPTLHFGSDKPMQGSNVWNIDTGAAFDGKLSCIDIDTKEVFQSDTLQSLYPTEKGRNKD